MTDAVQTTSDTDPWRDRKRSTRERVDDLLSRMTVAEKAHQLVGYWPAPSRRGEPVAPRQDEFSDEAPALVDVVEYGLGQLTRTFGTAPVDPADGVSRLRALQHQVAAGNRFGIPALAHEECLTGLATHSATVFPTPLAWGASFDPELVEEMAGAIGSSMRCVGVHQGLAPVLDVTRDYRWGRTEETIGEDPYLVGQVGAAYVRGLEGSGVVATLKHFAGYSSSRAGRNLAPVGMGPREFADVIVEPFVIALRDGGARSVMNSYSDVDGIPSAADTALLTGKLRGELGFDGLVVADYFSVSFLETLHGVADSPGAAAALALRAGLDVELPTVRCYGRPLIEMVERGTVPESLLDRAAARVLSLKCELGLLDAEWPDTLPLAPATPDESIDLDPASHRDIARRLAEESVVVVADNDALPISADTTRVAFVGPLADDPAAVLGCYTFPSHVGHAYPEYGMGVEIATPAEAFRRELPGAVVDVSRGCGVSTESSDDDDIRAAVQAARNAEVCVLVLGDRAGMFGRGTSGEGNDATSLELPGRQRELAGAVLSTGTPTILTVFSGRPYVLRGLTECAAAVVQAFFPGEEGSGAVAGVLSGRVEPSGRLPVSLPSDPAGQPGTYLHAPLAGPTDVSSTDPSPMFAFGHGLSLTRFTYSDLDIHVAGATAAEVDNDAELTVSAVVTNVGERAGTEVVQLYLSDPVASVVRPVRELAGFARIRLEPGRSARVSFTVHADRTSFTGPDLRRIVEPGRIDVAIGPSSVDLALRGSFDIVGETRIVGLDRTLTVPVRIDRLA